MACRRLLERDLVFGWIGLATLLLLTIPAIGMQFSHEVQWTRSDFVIMGMMLFGTGSVFVILARRVPRKRRVWLGATLLLLFLYSWAELAVGIFFSFGS